MDLSIENILKRTDSNNSIFGPTTPNLSSNATGFDINNSNDENLQPTDKKHKPIKFKVRKVSSDIPKPKSNNKQVQSVQLQYDQCTNKITKIQKEIDFLNNLLPPYNVEIDYHTRTKITRAIEKLTNKIDEIEKKKYNLGITLSRLWRDLDDSDIWVRTVSN
ncbi:hypothetical protein CLIB1444_04S01882 [[Candida] jaroonii]|uniref:Uncharacterized protein n=1 Tax=[Candida] jaroonii TaxID=467808 RepID=A0ACA9Y7V2_9ASCO|nr:hypothetical protein CLIB1444_04S01882 [[Candida] jaroonii]